MEDITSRFLVQPSDAPFYSDQDCDEHFLCLGIQHRIGPEVCTCIFCSRDDIWYADQKSQNVLPLLTDLCKSLEKISHTEVAEDGDGHLEN